MIQKIAFRWVKVLMKTTLFLQDPLHFTHNQFGQLLALLEIGLSLFLLGRHLLQSYLFPNAFPQAGIVGIDPIQFMKGNIALLSLIVMTVKAVLCQKRCDPGLKLRWIICAQLRRQKRKMRGHKKRNANNFSQSHSGFLNFILEVL